MEIRAIIGEDGEEYINSKDLVIVLESMLWKISTMNISVLVFVRRFIINLLTARRDS